MSVYQGLVAADSATSTPTPTAVVTGRTCVGAPAPPINGEWSLPGPRELIDANPGALDDPHHDYPAWDWLIPEGTPIYAIRGGVVATIHNWPHNWWTNGCDRGRNCDPCGVGVTIVDGTGARWSYCHGSQLITMLGATLGAGQPIMWSGNTGRSGTPHLHLELRVAGDRRCPQPLLMNLYEGAAVPDPRTLPGFGCTP
jgi:murein DD-endopeptidase MepM/ murein hydrolase activator NlpD